MFIFNRNITIIIYRVIYLWSFKLRVLKFIRIRECIITHHFSILYILSPVLSCSILVDLLVFKIQVYTLKIISPKRELT